MYFRINSLCNDGSVALGSTKIEILVILSCVRKAMANGMIAEKGGGEGDRDR